MTSAPSLMTVDDISLPVRRSRAERQAIVLDTAERLFPGRSSRSVGMDELVRETGLGKMTVYRLFKSKDDLVGAYLARKSATLLAFIDAELVRLQGDPRAALLSVVDAVERDVTRSLRGGPFNNVSSEYATRSTPPAALPPTTSSSCTAASSGSPSSTCRAVATTSPRRST